MSGACVLALLLGIGLLAPAAASATPIQLVGTTTGCFGAACGGFADLVSNTTFGLTFDGVDPFDVTTDASGNASNIVLGTFTRGNVNVSSALTPLPFTLQVVFATPDGIPGSTFLASIAGTTAGGGGPLDVDFDQSWQTVSFTGPGGAGTFDFRVFSDPQVTKNGVSSLLGEVRGGSLTTESTLPPQPVPEPGSVILLGTGLALAAWRARVRLSR